jgi:Ran GTPase-activating protein (RanGAP) involved in mRNA processing and transport
VSALQLDLSKNELCGVDKYGDGDYTAEGIIALADALKVTPSITSLSLGQNELGDEGAIAIAQALKESKVSKLASLDLTGKGYGEGRIGPTGAKELAEYLWVTASLTKISVGGNQLGKEGSAVLRKAVEGRSGFELKL